MSKKRTKKKAKKERYLVSIHWQAHGEVHDVEGSVDHAEEKESHTMKDIRRSMMSESMLP